jgi:hypothetical protein
MSTDKSNRKEKTKGEGICITDIVFLKYEESKAGNISVKFEYIPSDCSLNYLEIDYSDYGLEKYVEGNPYVRRNIDAYLRNKLLKDEFNYYYLQNNC